MSWFFTGFFFFYPKKLSKKLQNRLKVLPQAIMASL